MIYTARQLVEMSKIDWQQSQKNNWKEARQKAYNYYKGRTDEYLKEYFKPKGNATPIYDKVPIPNNSVTRRVINRISLVYMNPPIREYTNEAVVDMIRGLNHKMQRA